jgi:hypothetical protein
MLIIDHSSTELKITNFGSEIRCLAAYPDGLLVGAGNVFKVPYDNMEEKSLVLKVTKGELRDV